MKQKIQIDIELSETVIYSRHTERFETFCSQCGCLVEMATPLVAAFMTRSTERAIFRFVEAGNIHFIEHDRVLVCMRSLTKNSFKSPAPTGFRFLK